MAPTSTRAPAARRRFAKGVSLIKEKRNDRQRKISQFFEGGPNVSTVKKKGKKGKQQSKQVNFQGYTMSGCIYRKQIGEYCYVPRGYGKEYPPASLDGSRFCKDCLLEPCFTVTRRNEIHEEWKDLRCQYIMVEGGGFRPEYEYYSDLNSRMKEAMKGMYAGIFSKKYVKKVGLPLCAQKLVDKELPVPSRPADDDDADDEFEFGDDSGNEEEFGENEEEFGENEEYECYWDSEGNIGITDTDGHIQRMPGAQPEMPKARKVAPTKTQMDKLRSGPPTAGGWKCYHTGNRIVFNPDESSSEESVGLEEGHPNKSKEEPEKDSTNESDEECEWKEEEDTKSNSLVVGKIEEAIRLLFETDVDSSDDDEGHKSP